MGSARELLAAIVLSAVLIVSAWTAFFLVGIHVSDTLAFVLGVPLGVIGGMAANVIAERKGWK